MAVGMAACLVLLAALAVVLVGLIGTLVYPEITQWRRMRCKLERVGSGRRGAFFDARELAGIARLLGVRWPRTHRALCRRLWQIGIAESDVGAFGLGVLHGDDQPDWRPLDG
ncbi:hypothetical protein [Rhodococcus rhodochrous]|uniref:hypothetical protein n=1 Tax=Rhodococcus rhodochrous TaxID=1829 RepID=UPI0011AE9F52|nr:hypothetical protein [Rhodococcus rhodochrous]